MNYRGIGRLQLRACSSWMPLYKEFANECSQLHIEYYRNEYKPINESFRLSLDRPGEVEGDEIMLESSHGRLSVLRHSLPVDLASIRHTLSSGFAPSLASAPAVSSLKSIHSHQSQPGDPSCSYFGRAASCQDENWHTTHQ